MAAKGTIAKQELMETLKKALPDAFTPDEKILYVNMLENGEQVQIRVNLTAVKTPISSTSTVAKTEASQFSITAEEEQELEETLKEMGVQF